MPSNEQPALGCAKCAELENERLMLITENTELGNEIAGLQHSLRRQGAELVATRRELEKVREEDPKSVEIKGVLEYWRTKLGHPKAQIPLTGKRAKHVRNSLRTHSVRELLEAIDGLAMLPYVGRQGRKPLGVERERYDDIEYAVGDEIRINKMRDHWARANSAAAVGSQAMWDTYRKVAALQDAWSRLVLGAVAALELGVEPGEPLEAYLRRKHAAEDVVWAEIEELVA